MSKADKYAGRPQPPIPVDVRMEGDPPWDLFVQMAVDMGSTLAEAQQYVREARERYAQRRRDH